MRLTDGAVYKQGHAVETISAAVAEMVGLATNGVPVALMLADDAPLTFGTPVRDTRDDMRAFAQAGDYMFGQRDTADQALVTNDVTSKSALAFSGQIDKMLALYSKDGENPEIAALAALSAQNLSQPASIITLHTETVCQVLSPLISPRRNMPNSSASARTCTPPGQACQRLLAATPRAQATGLMPYGGSCGSSMSWSRAFLRRCEAAAV